MACAWAGFVAYGVSMLLSYFIGQHYYPVRYPLGQMGVYTLAALLLFAAMAFGRNVLPLWASLVVNSVLILLFVALIVRRDLPLSSLPVIGKKFK